MMPTDLCSRDGDRARSFAALALLTALVLNPAMAAPDITVIDDESGTILTDETIGSKDEVFFGCTQPGTPLSRIFTVRNDGDAPLTLFSNGLMVPEGFSVTPPWPRALVKPTFKVVVKKTDSRASSVDFTSFELITMPSVISIESVSIRIPEKWIAYQSDGVTPDAQTPHIDMDTDIVINGGSPSTLNLSPRADGQGWYCPNPDGDVCTEFGSVRWKQGSQNRALEAIVNFKRGTLTGSLDDPSLNGQLSFGYGLAGLNPPRISGVNNDGDAFATAEIEIVVVLFNNDPEFVVDPASPLTEEEQRTETVVGVFQDDGLPNQQSEVTFEASAVLVPVPVILQPGETWQDVVGAPLTVQLDAVTEGRYSGDWSMVNNDPDENPFNFLITGIVDGTDPVIVNLPADIEVPAVGDLCSAVVSWTPPTATDNLDPDPELLQTQGSPPGSAFPVGVHTIEYTAVDCAGNFATASFTVSVVDQTPPTLMGSLPCRIIANTAPGDTTVIVEYPPLTAIDDCDPNPQVICDPPSGSLLGLGLTKVCCVARDSSGNESAPACFDVVVIEAQPTPKKRTVDVVVERNFPAVGVPDSPDAVFFTFNHAFLNEGGGVLIEGTMLKAGTQNLGVWKDNGPGLELVARNGNPAPGAGLPISRFDDLILNDFGDVGLELFVSGATPTTDAVHANDTSGSLGASVVEGDTVPGTSAVFSILHEPAFDGQGATLSPANLALGTGGVTVANDTGIWRKPAGGALQQVAREGFPVGPAIPGANYGQIERRVVANDSGELALFAYLEVGSGGVTTDNNAAILSGPAGALTLVSREGDLAPGPDPALFRRYFTESINNGGQVAFEGELNTGGGGTPVTSANDRGVYTLRAGTLKLIARKGDPAPCVPDFAVFSSFRELYVADNGDVFFNAFLSGASVGTHNDGSFWHWRAGDEKLLPVLREGDPAPSTQGAVLSGLVDVAVSDDGLHAVTATLIPGIGDCMLSNNYGIWMDDGNDGLPILKMREGDLADLLVGEATVTVLFIDKTTNEAGGSGGHGKVLNDAGDLILRTSFDGNTSGVVILPGATAPPAP